MTAIARSAEAAALLRQAGARPVYVDLFDRPALDRAVAGHQVVINLATHIPRSTVRLLLPGSWRENDRLRRDASRLLVDAALAEGVERFIQESFAPTYRDCGDAWIDETTPIRSTRYNRTVTDDEPLGVGPPRSYPRWVSALTGSLGELMSRSQRIANRKLKKLTGWAPKYRSVREGWPGDSRRAAGGLSRIGDRVTTRSRPLED